MVPVHDTLSYCALQLYEVSFNSFNGCQVIERTLNSIANDQREITPKISKAELWFLYLKAFIQNLVQNGHVVSEKIRFEFLYVHDLGPRSSNDHDLQYSHTFMKSISCLHLPTFRSQASIVSEKSTVFTFSYRKA